MTRGEIGVIHTHCLKLIEKKTGALNAAVTVLIQKIATLENRLTAAEIQRDSLKARCDELQRQVDGNRRHVHNLESKTDKHIDKVRAGEIA